MVGLATKKVEAESGLVLRLPGGGSALAEWVFRLVSEVIPRWGY